MVRGGAAPSGRALCHVQSDTEKAAEHPGRVEHLQGYFTAASGSVIYNGVSIEEARGFRLKVAWACMPTMSSSACDLSPLSLRAA